MAGEDLDTLVEAIATYRFLEAGGCERGNTLLLGEESGLVFVASVADGLWLWAEWIPENSPGFTVWLEADASADAAVGAIQCHYAGWYVRKNNLDVPVDDAGCVVAHVEDE